jgi:hypothetical protein
MKGEREHAFPLDHRTEVLIETAARHAIRRLTESNVRQRYSIGSAEREALRQTLVHAVARKAEAMDDSFRGGRTALEIDKGRLMGEQTRVDSG